MEVIERLGAAGIGCFVTGSAGLGIVRVSTVEDLLLAKLEFADADLDGLQGRDIARLLVAYGDRLNDAYLRRHAAGLGVTAVLDEAIRRARR